MPVSETTDQLIVQLLKVKKQNKKNRGKLMTQITADIQLF